MRGVYRDNASEFVVMRKYLQEKGIEPSTSTPYSLQSNGVAERMNRILMFKVRAMLKDASTPWRDGEEAIGNTANLHNCTTSTSLKNITLYQSLTGSAPAKSGLRIFGCVAYVHVDKAAQRPKLAYRTQLKMYLGTLNGCY